MQNESQRRNNIDNPRYTVEAGLLNQRHNRSNNAISAIWPGDDTFSVSWTQLEDVRRYRVLAIQIDKDQWVTATAYAVGTVIYPVSANDLVFEATAIVGTGTSGGAEPTWPDVVGETVVDNAGANQITWTARSAKEVYVKSVEDATNEAQEEAWLATNDNATSTDVEYTKHFDGVWSEWQELSKDFDDLSLSRLGFLATSGSWEITVEAE